MKKTVVSLSARKLKNALKAILELSPERMQDALGKYTYYQMMGGKRPNFHDETGRFIAPVTDELVNEIMKMANEKNNKFAHIFTALKPVWPRQMLRAFRKERHKANRTKKFEQLADLAYDRHEAEIVDIEQPVKVEIENVDIVMQRAITHCMEHYGKIEVLAKSVGKRTTVVVFHEGREVNKPKFREVYEITDGTVRQLKASAGNRKPIEELEGSGWKWGKMLDHSALIERMAKSMVEENIPLKKVA